MSSPSANLEGLSERTVLRVSAVIAVASVMARRPDALFAPQFSWEDGPEWYQVARNFGFKSVGGSTTDTSAFPSASPDFLFSRCPFDMLL